MGKIISTLLNLIVMGLYLLLPLGWLYWLWIAIKVGGFAMFVLALFPITAPVASILGGWSFLFGVPEWVFNAFIN